MGEVGMIMEDKAEKRKEGYFEEVRGRKKRTNRANVLTDALAEKQGLPLRNQASNALGKVRLRQHLNQSGKAFMLTGLSQWQAVHGVLNIGNTVNGLQGPGDDPKDGVVSICACEVPYYRKASPNVSTSFDRAGHINCKRILSHDMQV